MRTEGLGLTNEDTGPLAVVVDRLRHSSDNIHDAKHDRPWRGSRYGGGRTRCHCSLMFVRGDVDRATSATSERSCCCVFCRVPSPGDEVTSLVRCVLCRVSDDGGLVRGVLCRVSDPGDQV